MVDEAGTNDTPTADELAANDTPMADKPITNDTPMADMKETPGNKNTQDQLNSRVPFELFCCVRCCFILFLSVLFLLFLSWSNL
jgi:hypothetical protein